MAATLHDPRYRRLIALLTTARKAAGLTQDELSARVGRPQSFLGKVETYQRRLDALEFLDLIAALDLSPATFVGQATATIGQAGARRRRRV